MVTIKHKEELEKQNVQYFRKRIYYCILHYNQEGRSGVLPSVVRYLFLLTNRDNFLSELVPRSLSLSLLLMWFINYYLLSFSSSFFISLSFVVAQVWLLFLPTLPFRQ